MKTLNVRGFSRDNTARVMKRGVLGSENDIHLAEDVEASVVMRFDKCLMCFDDLTHRPYMQLVEGRIRKVEFDAAYVPGIDADKVRVELPLGSQPEVNLKWDLSNDEIADLTRKGLFGFDYDYDHEDGVVPKPRDRGPIKTPLAFVSEDFIVPAVVDVRSAVCVQDKGDLGSGIVPVISVYPKDPFGMRTNSRVSGYGNISQYFAEPEFDLADYVSADQEYMHIDDKDMLSISDKVKEPKVLDADGVPVEPKKPDYLLTDEEKHIAEMAADVLHTVKVEESMRQKDLDEAKAASQADDLVQKPAYGVSGAAARVQVDAESMLSADTFGLEGEYL